jgi:uncharacterized Zn-binding protein involved in type VI secretion
MGDMTSHGGTIVTGSANVFFNGMPAAYALSMHVCPMVTPGTPPIPHVGMLAVPMGALTVLINGVPAIVLGDMFLCVGPPATVIMGSFNILIGMGGAGGGGGSGGGGASQAAMASALQAGKVSPVQGTEAYPIDIQATALVMQKYHTPEQFELDLKLLDSMAAQRVQTEQEEQEKSGNLTIKHFAGYFQDIESAEGYEAARHFACVSINYDKLTRLAKRFVDGTDTNPDNDPNIMPTRFMILYGADDSKLQQIDPHPDNFEGAAEHKLNVANLRKGLRQLGAKIAETGPYDDELWQAHARYINSLCVREKQGEQTHTVESGETLGTIARLHGLPSWKYLYEKNKETIGDNPDLLNAGIELDIPQWDSTGGDEKIEADGADPAFYTNGSRYRYPWVAFSTTITDEQNKLPKKKDNEKYKYELRDIDNGSLLAEGELSESGGLEVLIPDSQGLGASVDGWTCDIEMKG